MPADHGRDGTDHDAAEDAPWEGNPASPVFWFVMSMALLVGSILAYPINWWLVSYYLKHGMLQCAHSP
jgi:hypothetical protein